MMRNDQENARREEDEDDYEDSYAEDSEEEDDEYDYEYDESDDYSDEDEEDLRSTGGSQHRTTVDGGDDEIRDSEARGSSDPIGTRGASTTFRARPEVPVIPLGGQRVKIPRAVSWPGSKPEEDPPVGETSIKSVLRRSLTEPDNRINKSVSFSEDPEVNEFSALSDALQVDVDSPRADSSDHSPARANPYSNMPVEELCLLSQHLNAELSLLSQMDPEALAPDDGAAFSPSRIPITPTEMESPQEVRNETDAPTCEEESERVEPIQESENQRLPEAHESVAAMAETGTDVSREGGQAKPKVVHTVVALGPGPLNQEAATSSASSYSGHAFSSGLPGKAVPEMAPLSEVAQASDALEEALHAAGAAGVGTLQESSTVSTTAAELGVQSHRAEEDVPQPEQEPAHEGSTLNVVEIKEEEKDEEKDEDEAIAASLLAGDFGASDAEQPEGEPAASLDQAPEEADQRRVHGGVDYYEIGSDMDRESSASSFLESPRQWRSGRPLQPPSPITEHFLIGSNSEGGEPEISMEGSGSEADGEDPFEALGHAPPESESDLGEASAGITGFASRLGAFDMEAAWRADCAVHGASGQHTDSDVQTDDSPMVQQPTLEEAVKKISSKEQMAAKMEERRRKLEGVLPQKPPEVLEGAAQEGEGSTCVTIEECHSGQRTGFQRASSSGQGRAQRQGVIEETLQLDTGASSSQKPSEDDACKQAKAQHDPAQPVSEVAATVSEVKPGQPDTEANTSEKPSKDGDRDAKMQHDPAQPASEVAAAVSEVKPGQPDTKATTSEKPSKDGTGKETKVQHGPAQPAAFEAATTLSHVKQPVQAATEATTSEKPLKDGTGKEAKVQHDPAQPAASEAATAVSHVKQPVRPDTEATTSEKPSKDGTGKQANVQHGPAQPAASEAATTLSHVKQTVQADTEATTSEKPTKDGTGKQANVQHGPARPAASEAATTLRHVKKPVQRDTEATTSEKPSKDGTGKQSKVQHGPAQPAASEVATTVSHVKQPVQADTEATTSEKPSKDGTGKEAKVQHGQTQPAASEAATTLREAKQPVQPKTEATASQRPSEDDTDKQAKVQHDPAHPASEVAAAVSEVKPGQSATEATTSEKPSKDGTGKETNVHYRPAQPGPSEAATTLSHGKQPMLPDTEASTLEKPSKDGTGKDAKVQHGRTQPAAAEAATILSEVKQPLQPNTEATASQRLSEDDTGKEAKVQHGQTQPAASEAATTRREVKQPVQPKTEATASQRPSKDGTGKETKVQHGPAQPAAFEAATTLREVKQPVQAATEATTSEKPSKDGTGKEAKVQHDPAQPAASEAATAVSHVKQPVRPDTEATTSEKPSKDGKQANVQHGPAQLAASEAATTASHVKQPVRPDTEATATTLEKPSKDGTSKQAKVQHGSAQPGPSEAATMVSHVKQPMQADTEAATSEKPSKDGTGKQTAVQHGQTQSAVSKAATTLSEVKQPVQPKTKQATAEVATTVSEFKQFVRHDTEAKVQHGSDLPASSGAFRGISSGATGMERDTRQPDNVMHGPETLQESPRFGWDSADAQPRIGRTGSLPESQERPRLGILKKAKTESFMERPKALRFSTEVEIRDFTPRSPYTPSPLTQAVVVGTPVDPGSIPWLQQFSQGSQSSAASSKDKPFGDVPAQPSTHVAQASLQGSQMSRHGAGELLQRGRSSSVSLLQDVSSPMNRSDEVRGPTHGAEAAHPQVLKGKAPASSETGKDMPRDSGSTAPQPSRPLAQGAMQGSQISALSGDVGPLEKGRSHSLSLLADLSSPCDRPEVMQGPSHSAEAAHPQVLKGKAPASFGTCAGKDVPRDSRAIAPRPSRPLAQGAMQGSQISALSGDVGPLEKGRSHSLSLLADLSSPCDRPEVMQGPSDSAEAAHPQVLKGKPPASSETGKDMPRDSRATAPQPSRPLAQGAMPGSQNPALSGEGGPLERARSHSISLLPDFPTSCDSSEVMQCPSHSAEAAQSKNFRVKVAHQGSLQERQKESLGSQASSASGFLTWKEPTGTCDPGHPSAARHDSSGNRRRVRFQEPIATVAQYFYEMTQPNEGEELDQPSQPLPSQADGAALKTTVNCTSELTDMYTRQSSSRRARKNQEHHTHPSSSTHHNLSGHGGDEGFKNPIATVAQYLYQMTRPHEPQAPPQETQPDLSQPPSLQTTVNCSQELTDMYTRHGSHRSKKSRKHSERTARSSHGSLENIPRSQKEHSDARKVAFEQERWAQEFEKRVLERAYFQYINGVSEDEMYNYFEALRIEFGQRPY